MAAKTVDAMVNVEPYNAIAEADGIGTIIMNFWRSTTTLPVFMAATPDFVEKNPDAVVAYLKAWLEVAERLQGATRRRSSDVIYSFFTSKGYKMSRDTFTKAHGHASRSNPGFPGPRALHDQARRGRCCSEKKISAMPDWKKALRTDFMDKARTGS